MSPWGKLAWLLFAIGCSRGVAPHAPEGHKGGDAALDAGVVEAAGESNLPPAAADADSGTSSGSAGVGGSAPTSAAEEAGSGATPAAGGGGSAASQAGAGGAAGAGSGGAPAAPGVKASDDVFREDLLRTFELTFSDADWNQLQATAVDEIYVPAMLSVEGEQVGRIGVRYKGAAGTLRGCFSDGVQTCRKLSIKLKFDEYEPSLRYRGLKKLNLHSSLRDHSHLHERVTYKLFREFGVLAPRSVHARLVINGEYRGLYNLTEEVDGRFTDHRFAGPEGQGTLYKEAWPSSSQDPGYFSNAQQTNEGSPVTKIVRFADELANAPSAELGQVVKRWMDPDATLRYLAVHTATKHWDGPLTFYCSEEWGCNNHNYFVYESATRDHFAIVAWDTDNTFYEDVLTERADVPEWYEPVEHCDFDTTEDFLAPGCDRLVQGFVQLGLNKFRDVLSELLTGPFNVGTLQADVDRWAEQIDESVKTDPAGSGYEDWRGNVGYLKDMIAKRYDESAAIRDKL